MAHRVSVYKRASFNDDGVVVMKLVYESTEEDLSRAHQVGKQILCYGWHGMAEWVKPADLCVNIAPVEESRPLSH